LRSSVRFQSASTAPVRYLEAGRLDDNGWLLIHGWISGFFTWRQPLQKLATFVILVRVD
jgi:pimeloyl-ACP methyl ester carboxylesterase